MAAQEQNPAMAERKRVVIRRRATKNIIIEASKSQEADALKVDSNCADNQEEMYGDLLIELEATKRKLEEIIGYKEIQKNKKKVRLIKFKDVSSKAERIAK